MRWLPCLVLMAAAAQPVWAVDIIDVLRSSQQRRLDSLPLAAEGPRAAEVRRSFEALRRTVAPELAVELRVVTGPTLAETLHGHVIVVNESLADVPEGVRIFVLAHELGHVVQQHWLQVGMLYKRWVPGEVVPETTEPVAEAMGRSASGQAHRHEFEADAYAQQVLRRLGRAPGEALAAFMTLGMTQDTATHPGTRKRIAWLRAAELGAAPGSGGDAE